MGDPARDLSNCRQPFGLLQSVLIFRCVGILDLRQVEVDQRVERIDRFVEIGGIGGPFGLQRSGQSAAQPGQRGMREDMIQADLDMPPADLPAPGRRTSSS